MPESHAKAPVAAVDEREVRSLRDQVFIVPVSDNEWSSCGKHWMRDDSVEWLREKIKRPIKV